ncbi:SGNH/GDSL hydrolase family protein [Paramuribaculum intestinale]|uniref:SGNH/GDSL hydrolase family protein n=1 Tax=Paramuribaculum intestinale TaxID=2094151 RepID=UPI0025A9AA62|nr:SGNH/GDSL hydrolase family protein [Paramuribaculum intestinale]
MKTIRSLAITAMMLTAAAASAQTTTWNDPMKAGYPTVQNQAWTSEIGHSYARMPDRAEAQVRKPLWDLSRNSAGLALYFTTNSPTITVRYKISGAQAMPHMPATGVSGVDLYRIDSVGGQDFCFGSYSFGPKVQYSYSALAPSDLSGADREYHLNLPLYNTIDSLEIGVAEGSRFSFLPKRTEKPIVVYGTSIAQGACSSRPGMSWINIVRRNLSDYPVVNLGFSGNGRLEPEVLALIAEIDAEMFVLDCMPNLTQKSADEARDLVLAAVAQLRKSSDAPIILVEHAGYSNAPTNAAQLDCYTRLNRGQRQAYEQLKARGVKDLHYVSHDELAYPSDAWVDYVHPSDLGAQRQADVLTEKIRSVRNH